MATPAKAFVRLALPLEGAEASLALVGELVEHARRRWPRPPGCSCS